MTELVDVEHIVRTRLRSLRIGIAPNGPRKLHFSFEKRD